MRKTLLLVLSLLVGGIIASSMGCASEQRCPNAPKMIAKFSVGQRVIFTSAAAVWSCRSNPSSFVVERGDTGIVTDITYFDTVIVYEVSLDKAGEGEIMLAPAYVGVFATHSGAHKHDDLDPVFYPDPALAPRK